MLQLTSAGLYCPAGDFHIDPWSAVPRAVITHAHGDHLSWGCEKYLLAGDGKGIARERLGQWSAGIAPIAYGESTTVNGVKLSLHPAGHILGSAQVRVEHRGEVWVVSGDYKIDPDPTCAPWEPVRCHTFVTESTFGLPLYRWPSQQRVFGEINSWWNANADAGRTSLLFGYALGKAQRLIAGLDPSIGPILTHGSVERLTNAYRAAGVQLPPTQYAVAEKRKGGTRAIVIAPPSAAASPWSRKFGISESAFASGWMRVRGARRRRGVDRGFTLSDHVDWPQLMSAIDATGAQCVWVTHGFSATVVRWLTERGYDARVVPTRWEGERDDLAVDAADEESDNVDVTPQSDT